MKLRYQISSIFTFLIVLILHSCTSSPFPNDWQRANLKGKVRSMITSKYKVSGSKKAWTKGKKYSAGERGYVYNSEGMLTEIHVFQQDKLLGKHLNTFDASNHLQESKVVNEVGTIIEKTMGDFDKQKRLATQKQYDFQNNLLGVVESYEDVQGNITKRVAKNPKEVINYVTEFEYNAQNQLVQQTSYSDNKKLYPNYTALYKNYDKQGNFTVVEYQDKENNTKEIKTYQYIYDSKGNWTQMIEFTKNKAVVLSEREIEYY